MNCSFIVFNPHKPILKRAISSCPLRWFKLIWNPGRTRRSPTAGNQHTGGWKSNYWIYEENRWNHVRHDVILGCCVFFFKSEVFFCLPDDLVSSWWTTMTITHSESEIYNTCLDNDHIRDITFQRPWRGPFWSYPKLGAYYYGAGEELWCLDGGGSSPLVDDFVWISSVPGLV